MNYNRNNSNNNPNYNTHYYNPNYNIHNYHNNYTNYHHNNPFKPTTTSTTAPTTPTTTTPLPVCPPKDITVLTLEATGLADVDLATVGSSGKLKFPTGRYPYVLKVGTLTCSVTINVKGICNGNLNTESVYVLQALHK